MCMPLRPAGFLGKTEWFAWTQTLWVQSSSGEDGPRSLRQLAILQLSQETEIHSQLALLFLDVVKVGSGGVPG